MLIDVLGFSSLLHDIGLSEVYKTYSEVIEYVKSQGGILSLDLTKEEKGDSEESIGVGASRITDMYSTYFSDTIIFFVPYEPGVMRPFTDFCSDIMCHFLEAGVRVRGGVEVGDALLDVRSGIYLGRPLVEASRLEKATRWLGITLGPSATQAARSEGLKDEVVFGYGAHWKDPSAYAGDTCVLNWPAYWKLNNRGDLLGTLSSLDVNESYGSYYSNTREFVAQVFASESYQRSPRNWLHLRLQRGVIASSRDQEP